MPFWKWCFWVPLYVALHAEQSQAASPPVAKADRVAIHPRAQGGVGDELRVKFFHKAYQDVVGAKAVFITLWSFVACICMGCTWWCGIVQKVCTPCSWPVCGGTALAVILVGLLYGGTGWLFAFFGRTGEIIVTQEGIRVPRAWCRKLSGGLWRYDEAYHFFRYDEMDELSIHRHDPYFSFSTTSGAVCFVRRSYFRKRDFNCVLTAFKTHFLDVHGIKDEFPYKTFFRGKKVRTDAQVSRPQAAEVDGKDADDPIDTYINPDYRSSRQVLMVVPIVAAVVMFLTTYIWFSFVALRGDDGPLCVWDQFDLVFLITLLVELLIAGLILFFAGIDHRKSCFGQQALILPAKMLTFRRDPNSGTYILVRSNKVRRVPYASIASLESQMTFFLSRMVQKVYITMNDGTRYVLLEHFFRTKDFERLLNRLRKKMAMTPSDTKR